MKGFPASETDYVSFGQGARATGSNTALKQLPDQLVVRVHKLCAFNSIARGVTTSVFLIKGTGWF